MATVESSTRRVYSISVSYLDALYGQGSVQVPDGDFVLLRAVGRMGDSGEYSNDEGATWTPFKYGTQISLDGGALVRATSSNFRAECVAHTAASLEDAFDQAIPVSGGGSGAAAFTDLEDAPGAITPSGVVVGNDAGNGLRMSDVIYITESDDVEIDTTTSDAGLSIRANGTAGMSIEATGDGGMTLDVSGAGQLYMDVSGSGGLDIHNLGVGRTRIQGGDNGLVLEAKAGAALEVNNVTDVGSAAIPATRDAVLRVTCDGVEYLIPLIAAA